MNIPPTLEDAKIFLGYALSEREQAIAKDFFEAGFIRGATNPFIQTCKEFCELEATPLWKTPLKSIF